jgi:secreted PhoX family phosphatase
MMSKGKKKNSRRGFLKGVAVSAATVTTVELLKKQKADAAEENHNSGVTLQPTEFDFTQKSAALQPDKIVDSACQWEQLSVPFEGSFERWTHYKCLRRTG